MKCSGILLEEAEFLAALAVEFTLRDATAAGIW
jgi:hypothetical protein